MSGSLLPRCGPLSLLAASMLLVVGGLVIGDLRTGVVAILVEMALAPVLLGPGGVPLRRLAPGVLAVASVGFSNWLLSTGHDPAAGATAALRVAFFVVPGVALASYVDPFTLGDHLGQRLHLPARPVLAAVAALQRLESLGDDWDQLSRARRVRGLGPGRSPVSRGRYYAAMTFSLLVQALRQATRMSVAMEARGFSAATVPGAPRRTWSEPAPWLPADTALIALAALVTGIPVMLTLLA